MLDRSDPHSADSRWNASGPRQWLDYVQVVRIKEGTSQMARWPDHPVLCTFAARMPFALRLSDRGIHRFDLVDTYADAEEAKLFTGPPFVQIRVCNLETGGLQIESPTTASALNALYGVELPSSDFEAIPGLAYEQWVSMKTPSPRLSAENREDAGYAFHRCLRVLDLFLRSHNLVFHDPHVYPVSTQELGNVVYIGEYEPGGKKWRHRSPMLLHPGRLPAYTPYETSFKSEGEAIAWGARALVLGRPFARSVELVLRAERASGLRGDYADAVISLQTALESRLYETWQLLLVDKGEPSAEIARRVGGEMGFRSLLLTVLPKFLGGNWNATDKTSPVGACWETLYLLRNRVVHAGHNATPSEFDAGRAAYDRLRHFVRERLWAKRNEYPRAAVAVIGRDGMVARGWSDPVFERRIEQLLAEPNPYFLAWDIAGRPHVDRRESRHTAITPDTSAG